MWFSSRLKLNSYQQLSFELNFFAIVLEKSRDLWNFLRIFELYKLIDKSFWISLQINEETYSFVIIDKLLSLKADCDYLISYHRQSSLISLNVRSLLPDRQHNDS